MHLKMNRIAEFTIRRLLATIPVLIVMSLAVFMVIHLVPGDPVRTMLGINATPTNIAATRAQMGLDRPIIDQYFQWVGDVLHGNLGEDLLSHTPVTTLIGSALPVTLELMLSSLVIGVGIGVAIGAASAASHGVWRRLAEGFSVLGISIPYFWLGIMLALLFAGELHLLPPSGFVSFTSAPLKNLEYMVLPVITLATTEAAYLSRITRSTMTQVLAGPSVTYLRAKGLSHRLIVYKHALRQASPPIMTIVGIEAGLLLGGAIVVENIFGLPGLGTLLVNAVQQRDYTVVQGAVLTIAVIFVLATLATDLVVGVLDPRVGARR